ncbi:MAG: hypothetical protein AAB426_05790, partial [Myxococcota bacterium]
MKSTEGDTSLGGDELYDETTFVPPTQTGGRWILRAAYRKRQYAAPGSSVYSEELTYYDGAPFTGLPLGQLTQGKPSRVAAKRSADSAEVVTTARTELDADGNVLTLLDANGHQRRFAYDADNLLPVAEEVVFDDASRTMPYALRLEVEYDPTLDQVIRSADWRRYESDVATSPARETFYAYDRFGRITKIAKPGDTLDLPTASYAYELGDPVSRIIETQRSQSGGVEDVETVQCFDAMGRKLQSRVRTAPGLYQVAALTTYNVLSKPAAVYEPYTSASAGCEASAPGYVLSTATSYDATGRALATTQPDGDVYGTPSTRVTHYLPLAVVAYDENDTDNASDFAGTPTTTRTDGLGRTVRIERLLAATATPDAWQFGYDALGNLASVIDAHGNEKRQHYDLLGRLLTILDPDAGVIQRSYDDAGNLASETDARGLVREMSYDEANRLQGEWLASEPVASVISYGYDAVSDCPQSSACTALEGRLASVSYAGGSEHFGYDPRGRQVYAAKRIEGHLFALGTSYDNLDRAAGRSYPDGQSTTFAYDAAGRLTGVPGYVSAVGYNSRGLPSELDLANATSTLYTYDSRLRLGSLFTLAPQSTLLLGYGYAYDRVGNITASTDSRPDDGTPSASAEYHYDAYSRLIGADLDRGTAHAESLSYGYDGIDNITFKRSSLGS